MYLDLTKVEDRCGKSRINLGKRFEKRYEILYLTRSARCDNGDIHKIAYRAQHFNIKSTTNAIGINRVKTDFPCTAFFDFLSEKFPELQPLFEWLKGIVKMKAFRKAKHRIVIMHIPPVTERMAEVKENAKDIKNLLTWRGGEHLGELMIPILNEANINVMLCGHLHRHVIYPEQEGVLEFPIVVNDNVSSLLVRTDSRGVHVKSVHMDGHTNYEKTY